MAGIVEGGRYARSDLDCVPIASTVELSRDLAHIVCIVEWPNALFASSAFFLVHIATIILLNVC